MIKNFLLSIFLFSILVPCQAQEETLDQTLVVASQRNDETFSLINIYGVNSFDLREYKVEGSIFLSDSWRRGTVELYDGSIVDEYTLLFNKKDQSVVISIDERVFTLPINTYKSFKLESISLAGSVEHDSFTRLQIGDDYAALELLVDGSTHKLFVKHGVKIIKGSYNAALDVGNVNDKILDQKSYYIMENEVLTYIPDNTSKFRKAFDKDSDIYHYVRLQNLDLKSESDLIKLIQYLNKNNKNENK